ncbi:alpha/beta fold hydrolase [Fulvivirga sp. M361]|uniref:alpha/beta fold hydrolase n=1 Tax=Fulvivirga sp. M361 TaxID=2594266 RepID=UPI001179C0F7|nr:alpha/beta fold hydrolase [Fulvivirga sp. M361]TRX62783.1 alpha/beta fold hydrolase [Fulvivirga sp. M361]
MQLYHRVLGEGKPLIILHGLFGSSDNWLSVGKVLAEKYKVFLVDQRNHGQSPHSDEFNYTVMADDLQGFIDQQGIMEPDILGHSMGGKTAMKFAIKYPELWQKLIVVDIGPKYYPVHHRTILDGLASIDLTSVASRGEADKQLANYVPHPGVRQFLLKNLARNENGFQWKINLPVIDRNIEIIGEALTDTYATDKDVLFIRGALSDYISDSDNTLIKTIFPSSSIATVDGAGHWVHAEKPQELLQLVLNFLT